MDDDGRVEEMQVELAERAAQREEEADEVERERRARVTGVNIRVDRTPNGTVIGDG